MKNYQRQIVKIIKEIASEKNYAFSTLADGFLIEISNEENTTRIFGYQFDNSTSASLIATDKCACFELLQKHNIPCVPHFLILPPEKAQFVEKPLEISQLTKKYATLVAKPCKGTSGAHVYKFQTESEYAEIQKKILPFSRDIAISPYLNIQKEYRCVVLNGKPLLIYEKVLGDGWKHNLSHGATPQILDISSHGESAELAVKTASALSLDFCAVDIAICKGDGMVLEVNSGAMFEKFATFSHENYQIAKNIYEKALKHFLKEGDYE